ncbi:MAG: SRPBCC family protein [Actinomycetota bacterium]|nr:SRPBCC family protein [Actinomycetota bacterium]
MVEINEKAPVKCAGEIEIAAPPEIVWDVLTAINDWPSWNPHVKSASLQGGLEPGSEFRWKAGPSKIVSTLQQVEPPRLLAWTGKTMGIKAVHVWRLEPRNGSTLVRAEESFDGLLARVLRAPLQKMLDKSLQEGLQHLKAEAERRAAT